jgi:putative transposase
MNRLQAYKYELMPDGEQRRSMCRFAGSCRFVYNKALALQKENYEAGNKTAALDANRAHQRRTVGRRADGRGSASFQGAKTHQ